MSDLVDLSSLLSEVPYWDTMIETIEGVTVTVLSARIANTELGDALLLTIEGTYGDTNEGDTSIVFTKGKSIMHNYGIFLKLKASGKRVFPHQAVFYRVPGGEYDRWQMGAPNQDS